MLWPKKHKHFIFCLGHQARLGHRTLLFHFLFFFFFFNAVFLLEQNLKPNPVSHSISHSLLALSVAQSLSWLLDQLTTFFFLACVSLVCGVCCVLGLLCIAFMGCLLACILDGFLSWCNMYWDKLLFCYCINVFVLVS